MTEKCDLCGENAGEFISQSLVRTFLEKGQCYRCKKYFCEKHIVEKDMFSSSLSLEEDYIIYYCESCCEDIKKEDAEIEKKNELWVRNNIPFIGNFIADFWYQK